MDIELHRFPVPTTLDAILPGEFFTVHSAQGTWTAFMSANADLSATRSIVLSGPEKAGYTWPESVDVTAFAGTIARTPATQMSVRPGLGDKAEFGQSAPIDHGALAVDADGTPWLVLQNSVHTFHYSLKTGTSGEPKGPTIYYRRWGVYATIEKRLWEVAVFGPKS